MISNLENDIPLSTAQAAYSGVSFTPEKRAIQEREGYAQQMQADYEQLANLVKDKPSLQATMEAEFERYRQGYRQRLLRKLASDSRCMSWMITGPANFPVRRMEKRNEIAHKRLEELIDYRKRALAAITKTLCPELRPIMAGDADAVQTLRTKLEKAEQLHAQMVAVNQAHKAFLKDPASLDASTLPDSIKEKVRNYKPEYSWEPHPIAPFQLTNSSANIRRMRERLEKLEVDKILPDTVKTGEHGIRFEDCPPDNRVRLFFPGKPDADLRQKLKSNGFRWTPSLGCWQAYRNHNTVTVARSVAGI